MIAREGAPRVGAATHDNDWPLGPLSDYYDVLYGKANPGGGGPVPVVGSSGVYDWTRVPLVREPTVVVGRKGSAGRPWLIEVPCHPSDTTFYLAARDASHADLRFTYYAISAFGPGASDDVIPSLQKQDLEGTAIPIPPLVEQRAIGSLLSRLQAAIALEDRRIALLKELKAATMAKVFRDGLRGEQLKPTEIGEVPATWAVVPLAGVLQRMNYGTSVRCSLEPKGTPVLRIPNVLGGDIDQTQLKYAELPAREADKVALVPGDLLFVRTNGNREYTGRCAVYGGSPADAAFASYLIRARLRADTVLPQLVQYFLSSVGREQIIGRANPAADGKFNIDTGILKTLMLPQPSRDEQREIVGLFQHFDQFVAQAQQRFGHLNGLFRSALHELMTAQLRVTPLLDQEAADAG